MKRTICICVVLLLALSNAYGAAKAPDVSKVRFEITQVSKTAGVLHWKITNNSDAGVYIYSFFLLGPAYNIERSAGRVIFDTTPIERVASCPPNRVAPLLLFFVRTGGVIEVDFADRRSKRRGVTECHLRSRLALSRTVWSKKRSASTTLPVASTALTMR